MQLTGKRIFTAVMLVSTAITVYQVMSKPQPVTLPSSPSAVQAKAQAFDHKLAQLEVPRRQGSAPAEIHFTSDEVSAEVAQSVAASPTAPQITTKPVGSTPASPDQVVAPGDVQVKGYQVKLEGDIAHGQFLTQVAGRDIYVTLAGRLGSQVWIRNVRSN